MSLPHASEVLTAISRLHNYTINQKQAAITNAPINAPMDPQLGYLPTTPDKAYGDIQAPFRNVSLIYKLLVEKVACKGMVHPGRH